MTGQRPPLRRHVGNHNVARGCATLCRCRPSDVAIAMRINANPSSVVQLKVTLIGTDPPVWRRVKVPADLNLRRLHDVIQVTMGWWDQHPHQFVIGNRRYGDPETSDGPTVHKDNLVRLE